MVPRLRETKQIVGNKYFGKRKTSGKYKHNYTNFNRTLEPDPNKLTFEFTLVTYDDSLLIVFAWKMHVYFGNAFNALQRHVGQHIGFNTTQKDFIIHLVKIFFLLIF